MQLTGLILPLFATSGGTISPFRNGITVGAEAMAGLPSQNPPNGYIHAKTQKEEDLVR